MKHTGIYFAFVSAVLFGISPALVKMLMGEMSPILLAGFLYLGSGAGLHLILIIQRQSLFKELKGLERGNYFRLTGAVVAGGILAPLFLVYGIRLGTAFEVSLLLNLETVATTIIAWLVFQEHVGRHQGCSILWYS
jgi:drug/metabolite transporter (DMT)-like permease